MQGTTPVSSDVYYSGLYWNALPAVVSYMNEFATGDPAQHWHQHLAARHGKPFRRALSINCGNGWVERDLIRMGVVEAAVGIDFSDDLLTTARQSAASQSMAIEYLAVDINTFDFDLDGIDLVINFAAAHHIALIDRVLRHLSRMLGPDGVFVSYDYVGPHRNQYPAPQWEAIWTANEALPADFRRDLRYAHLPTMLAQDPTEAIHSELIVPTMRRYFDLPVEHYLGGSVAYDILSFNPPFHGDNPDAGDLVAEVLEADRRFRAIDPAAHSLFAYVVATPRAGALDDADQLAAWTAQETARESAARLDGGRYYPATVIASLYDRIHELEGRPSGPAWLPPDTFTARREAVRRVAARIPGATTALRSIRQRIRPGNDSR